MSANGTTLGTASIIGSFTGTPSWSLTDALGVFQINSSTGVVTVLNNTNLNHSTHPTIPITISVSGTTPPTTSGNFTINVTTNAVIALSNTSIIEMSPNGTALGTASITGSFTGTPSWSLTDALGVFQINSSTGAVTVLNNTNLVNATHPTIPITISVSGVTPSISPGNFTINDLPTGSPGLVAGTYGSTTTSGWTFIGPSDGTLASGKSTNIIYVSSSLGDDNRDGSTPTFVDDNNTAQFVLSPPVNVFLNDVYKAANGQQFTVAVSNSFLISGSDVPIVQMKNRTGSTPNASGTLTCLSGAGAGGTCQGSATMNYTAVTLGIHGPVKTLIKAVGGTGPGAYPPDNSDFGGVPNGDGTGLGTKGTWRTTGSVASSFALRSGAPDWVLLRMGDTWVGEAFEISYNGTTTGNFNKGGFSEREPMVISAYDEAALPVTTPDVGSGSRARPIVQVPSGTVTYATSQPAGSVHAYLGRNGIQMQSGGASKYIVIMGIDFYAAQRDPGNGAYLGQTNIVDNTAVFTPGGVTGVLVEDTRSRWLWNGFSFSDQNHNFDINIRRSQVDHCYAVGIGHPIGTADDDIAAAGGVGGAISPGFNFEENVFDLCGYTDPSGMFAFSDSRSRNVYIQWNALFGNRRGNTSTRSGSEDVQFRSGGLTENNYTYQGSYGMDIGHPEGFPMLTSSTTNRDNVVQDPIVPSFNVPPVGINFYNTSGITSTNNLIIHQDQANSASALYAQTDAYDGTPWLLAQANNGTGGTQGSYAIGAGGGCFGGSNFTGGTGSGTTVSSFTISVGSGGSITGLQFIEPSVTATSQYVVGDILTPIANSPSLNTQNTSLTNAGSGGTLGDYGTAFGHCPRVPTVPAIGDAVTGIALTGGTGSGAMATYMVNAFTAMSRALNGGTGNYDVTGTPTNGTAVINLSVGDLITVTGAVPSAYNGTWAITGTPGGNWVYSLGTSVDPGPITVPGKVAAYQIVAAGAGYTPGDVLSLPSGSVGGQTGIQITVNSVAHLSGWTVQVAGIFSHGTHGLNFTANTMFNWPDPGPPGTGDLGGTHDTPWPGGPGSGTANTWTGNILCTGAQFPASIASGTLSVTGTVVNGPIAIGQNLSGPGVTAGTTIISGSGTSWGVSPTQTVSSTTMYSYTCTPTTVFTSPYRTVQTYSSSLGFAGTIDGYMGAALANARWNWNPALTANNGLNPYIRHGFGMTP